MSNSLDPDQAQQFVGPDLGPNCLKRLATADNSIGKVTGILAHRIQISEILPWDRKSHLTHAILPRLSCEGYIHWLYWNSRTCLSSDVIAMLKWRHHVKLYINVFMDFWKLIFK